MLELEINQVVIKNTEHLSKLYSTLEASGMFKYDEVWRGGCYFLNPLSLKLYDYLENLDLGVYYTDDDVREDVYLLEEVLKTLDKGFVESVSLNHTCYKRFTETFERVEDIIRAESGNGN